MGKSWKVVALAMAGAVSVTACSAEVEGNAEPGGPSTPELTKIVIGATAAVSNAALQLGVEQGFFKDEGLEVEISWAQGGAAIVPAVMSGEQQFGESNVVSLLVASAEGLPIEIVGPSVLAATDPTADHVGVIVAANSPIRTAQDLAGKTVAVNAFSSIADVTTRASLKKRGVDSDSVNFVEMPFPEMSMALERGQIDAAWQVEPFLTPMLKKGARMILPTFTDVKPGMQFGLMFTTAQYRQGNPEVVERFQRALRESLAYANENLDAVRQVAIAQFKVDPSVAGDMRLPSWNEEIDRESVELIAELLVDYEMIDEKPDVKAFTSGG